MEAFDFFKYVSDNHLKVRLIMTQPWPNGEYKITLNKVEVLNKIAITLKACFICEVRHSCIVIFEEKSKFTLKMERHFGEGEPVYGLAGDVGKHFEVCISESNKVLCLYDLEMKLNESREKTAILKKYKEALAVIFQIGGFNPILNHYVRKNILDTIDQMVVCRERDEHRELCTINAIKRSMQ